ncbi:unnamed protein product, partial [Adineta ricciae]
ITFDNEPVSFIIQNATNCSTIILHSSTYATSTLLIFKFEWLTIVIISILFFGLFLLLLLTFHRIRQYRLRRRSHHRLRQDSNLYYKSSQMTTTTSGSCTSTSSEHDGSTLPVAQKITQMFLSGKYDDMTSEQQSMGSYIYPITSTTSLLQTTPSSSVFQGEQYAVIDGNYSSNTYKQWSNNNTFHYASSDIEQIEKVYCNQHLSLFNCIIPREILSSKSSHSPPIVIDESKLIAIRKVSETGNGEIYFGNYFINNEPKCVLIKIVKSNSIHSSRQTFLNEMDILSRLNHPNLACLYGAQLKSLYLVQEHSHFGSLQDYFHTLSNHQTNDTTFQKMNMFFAYQLANALQYLSQLNLIHGDVATRNCL